ncbi:MAG TPA: ATP-binding protein [Leptospiraceae bacterium]|nr:ATP-binding protein [Leptospiraceae bacterium]
MTAPYLSENETERLENLRSFQILDTYPEEEYDSIARLVSLICEVPTALISLVDSDRQWFKSKINMNFNETPRDISFCGHAILDNSVFIIENAAEDMRFRENPLVTGYPKIRFYAGAPLVTNEGYNIGTLCAIDYIPKRLSPEQTESLVLLSRQVVNLFEARKLALTYESAIHEIEKNRLNHLKLESRYYSIVSSMKEGVIQTDVNGIILSCNISACRILGMNAQELEGRHFFFQDTEFLKGDSTVLKEEDHPVSMVLKNRTGYEDIVIGLKLPNGRLLWINVNSEPILENDQFAGAVISFADITEKKIQEEELNAAKKAADEGNRIKSEFLSIISHEIKTPLNSILGVTSLLLEEKPRPDQEENLSILKTSAKNLHTLISDILDYSELESGKARINEVEFDPAEYAQNILRSYSGKAEDKKISLNITIDSNTGKKTFGDALKFQQVLSNLLSNALKFTQNGSVSMDMKITEQDGMINVRTCVKDTGIGIAEENLNRIFERFTQEVQTYSRKFEGTGLGLAITKKIIDLLGGSIQVESVLNEGSSFTFQFPFKISAAEKKTVTEFSQPYHILLVEDDQTNAWLACKYMKKWNLITEHALNGKEALKIADTIMFDLILMDIQMPEMDGFEAAEIMRSRNISCPILAFTAANISEIKERIFASGMNDFIVKPIQPSLMYKIMKKYLEKSD